MASVVEICNLALGSIGDIFITALTENTKEARRCAKAYDPTRRGLLREFDWGFARSRAELAALATAPAFGFTAAFPLPVDCLHVRQVVSDVEWAIEGRSVLASGDSLQIIYTADVSDPNQFDALFTKALAAGLAVEIAYSLAPSKDMVKNLHALYELSLAKARRLGAIESDWKTRSADLESNAWTEARA